MILCPVPWLNSDLGNKEGVCDLGPLVPERWLGEMEEMELAGMGQGSTVLSPIFESLEACLSAC